MEPTSRSSRFQSGNARRLARAAAFAGVSTALGIGALATPANAVAVPEPDLVVTVSGPTSAVWIGTAAKFTATVTNVGNDTATNPRLALSVPAQGILGSTSIGGTTGFCLTEQTLDCTLGSLAAGQSATVAWTVTQPTFTGAFTTSAHTWTASAESNVTNNVASVQTTVQKYTTKTQVSTSVPSSVYGQSVTFTAKATDVVRGLTYSKQDYDFTVDGVTTTVNSGTGFDAAYTTSTLSAGQHFVKVHYRGNAFSAPSDTAMWFAVAQARTVATVSAPPTALLGHALTVKVSLGVAAPGRGFPDGSVTVSGPEGTSSATLVNGVANITYIPTMRGSRSFTVTYAGSPNYAGSTSAFNILVN